MTKFISKPACPMLADSKPAPELSPQPRTGAGTPSGRAVAEWRGSSPDTKVPPRVRARVFLAHEGKCWITGRKIMPADYWELDHKIALANGGEHAESNLAPALRDAHRIKTRADVQEKSKVARLRKRHIGIKKPRTIRAWRRFSGEIVFASKSR